MPNSITEGKERELPPDADGEIKKTPTPAIVELKTEVLQASAYKEAGQSQAMRERSSIESRTDLRLAATNETMRADPARPAATLLLEQDVARRWADLDASDLGRIRSEPRRENALEAIAGHARVSSEYSDELKKRSPALASAVQNLNQERAKLEQEAAAPAIARNSQLLGASPQPDQDKQRELARDDARSLAALPEGRGRHVEAVTVGENAKKFPAYQEELQRTAPELAREAQSALLDRTAARSVESRSDELLKLPKDALLVKDAREAVKADVEAMKSIKGEVSRYDATLAVSEAAINQVNYRAELQLQAPDLVNEVQASRTQFDKSVAEMENRKAQELAAIQKDKVDRATAWSPEQAAIEAKKDATTLAVVDTVERAYLLADMALASRTSKVYAETLVNETPQAAKEVQANAEQEAARQEAARQHQDRASASAQTRAALIDAAAIAALATVRSRETAKAAMALATDAPSQQRRQAQELLKAPPLDGRVTAPNDPDIAAQAARAIKRPVSESELSESILGRYVVSQEKRGLFDKGSTEFTLRDGQEQGRVAFVDVGKTLTTQREDKATIRAMIEVATSKNWKEITLSGTEEFRRNAWLEASLNDVKTKGYEPREADKQILSELQRDQNKTANTITFVEREQRRDNPQNTPKPIAAQDREPQRKHIDGDALTIHEKTVLDNSRAILDSKALGEKFTKETLRELESKLRGERVYVGEIVDHGKAPYKFDKNNDDSYYVTLKTRAGEQVIWGKTLVEAMQDRTAGEQIVLKNVGKTDVTVQERVRDQQGKVVDIRPKDSQLNAWRAELLSRFTEKARTEFSNRASSAHPSMAVYDNKAPRVDREHQKNGPNAVPEQERKNLSLQQRNARER